MDARRKTVLVTFVCFLNTVLGIDLLQHTIDIINLLTAFMHPGLATSVYHCE